MHHPAEAVLVGRMQGAAVHGKQSGAELALSE